MPNSPLNLWASPRDRLILSHRNIRYFPQARYAPPNPHEHQVLLVHAGLAMSLSEARCRSLFGLGTEVPTRLFDLDTHSRPPGVLSPDGGDIEKAARRYASMNERHIYLKLDAEDAWRTLAPLAALTLSEPQTPIYIASHNLAPFIAADPYSAFDQVCTIFISPWLTKDETGKAFTDPNLSTDVIWEATGGEPLLLQALYDHPAEDRTSALRSWTTNPPSFVESWKRSLRQQLKDNPEIRTVVRAAVATRGTVERLSWTSLPLVYGGWVTDRCPPTAGPSWYMPKLHQTWARSLLIEQGY